MNLTITPVGYNNMQTFTGIRMTNAAKTDAARLLQEYIDKPSLQLRDKIFEIMDPYLQRQAKKIAEKGYYFDDVLQNMRINLFELLDIEHVKATGTNNIPEKLDDIILQRNLKKLKTKLFHYIDHTQDAKIPQRDNGFISLTNMNPVKQDRLLHTDIFEKQSIIDNLDDIFRKVPLHSREQDILRGRFEYDMEYDEIGNIVGLSKQRVLQLKGKIIKYIREKFNIKTPGEEVLRP